MNRERQTLERAQVILRHNLFLLLLIQAIIVTSFVFVSRKMQHTALGEMAAAATTTLDIALSEGRFQESLASLGSLAPRFFSTIGVFDERGNLIKQEGVTQKNTAEIESRLLNPSFFEASFRRSLTFKTTPNTGERHGLVVFIYDTTKSTLYGFLGWIAMGILTLPLFIRMHTRLKNLFLSVIKAEKEGAVAQMMQMLAHDVKKPFSMLKMTLDAICRAPTLERVKSIAAIAIPDIDRAMRTTNGLIQDVMEVNSQATPMRESATLASLLETSLTDTFRAHPHADIEFDYNLRHTSELLVDTNKVLRVFSNIISNGLEAMKETGAFHFSARTIKESNQDMVEISIANDGPPINKESLVHLFDAFFTEGKKGGTGLGLAIAQKIVIDHGGRIRCTLTTEKWVEFSFTLPAAHGLYHFDPECLPKHSRDISTSTESVAYLSAEAMDAPDSILKDEALIETDIIPEQELPQNPADIVVIVIDDDELHLMLWKDAYRGAKLFETPESFLEAQKRHPEILSQAHCIVIDNDFGRLSSMDGLSLAKEISSQFSRPIFLSSHVLHPEMVYKEFFTKQIGKEIPEPKNLLEMLKEFSSSHKNAGNAA